MDRSEKQVEIDFLASQFTDNSLALCADYRGLTVAEFTELRSQLSEVGASGKVVKNTLAKISAKKAYGEQDEGQVEAFVDMFNGPSFVVFANDDIVAPAKVFAKFSKDKEAFEIKGGWFEGACMNEDGVKTLSDMPSKEELLSSLLRLINAPATQLARLIQAPGQQLAQVLGAHRANLESAQ